MTAEPHDVTSTDHVAVVTDRAYLRWAAVASLSAATHHCGRALTVHLVTDGSVPAGSVEWLASEIAAAGGGHATLAHHPVDLAAVDGLPPVGRFSEIVWLRLLLPELLPGVPRVLYLDADTLTVADLGPILHAELGTTALGAVTNVSDPADWDRLVRIGLVEPAASFNSGVLLMDLDRLRRGDLLARARDIAAILGDRMVWPDQDVLNIAFAGAWTPLDAAANVQTSFTAWPDVADRLLGSSVRAAALAAPRIIHFEGPEFCKPWHPASDHAYADAYRAVAATIPDAFAPPSTHGRFARVVGHLPRSQRTRAYVTAHAATRPRSALRTHARGWVETTADRLGVPLARPDTGASTAVPHPLSSATAAERTIVARARPYTMTSNERLLATIDATNHVLANDIPGALVECGVWLGGSTLAMVLTLLDAGVTDRDIYLYDTYTGMTAPGEADTSRFHRAAQLEWDDAERTGARMYGHLFGESIFGLGIVQRLLHETGYPPERLHFVVGPVEETLPQAAPDVAALIRLDTDWYESTRHELEHLEPRLSVGGVVVIDDYGHWDGARRAVDEYYAARTGPTPLLHRTDYAGRVVLKSDPTG